MQGMNVHVGTVLSSAMIIEVPAGRAGCWWASFEAGRQCPTRDCGPHHRAHPSPCSSITVFFPFIPPAGIDNAVLRRLAGTFGAVPVISTASCPRTGSRKTSCGSSQKATPRFAHCPSPFIGSSRTTHPSATGSRTWSPTWRSPAGALCRRCSPPNMALTNTSRSTAWPHRCPCWSARCLRHLNSLPLVRAGHRPAAS